MLNASTPSFFLCFVLGLRNRGRGRPGHRALLRAPSEPAVVLRPWAAVAHVLAGAYRPHECAASHLASQRPGSVGLYRLRNAGGRGPAAGRRRRQRLRNHRRRPRQPRVLPKSSCPHFVECGRFAGYVLICGFLRRAVASRCSPLRLRCRKLLATPSRL